MIEFFICNNNSLDVAHYIEVKGKVVHERRPETDVLFFDKRTQKQFVPWRVE